LPLVETSGQPLPPLACFSPLRLDGRTTFILLSHQLSAASGGSEALVCLSPKLFLLMYSYVRFELASTCATGSCHGPVPTPSVGRGVFMLRAARPQGYLLPFPFPDIAVSVSFLFPNPHFEPFADAPLSSLEECAAVLPSGDLFSSKLQSIPSPR